MPIHLGSLDASLKALVLGMVIGDVFYLDGTRGDDNAPGDEAGKALRTLVGAATKPVSGNHDYILAFGVETALAAVSFTQANLHLIGIGNGGAGNVFGRGFQYTRAATVDGIQLSTAADRMEIAGISFIESATDGILLDDAGAIECWFHDNTVYGSGTASDAVRLDLEGARWTVSDNHFYLCKLAIDIAGAECVITGNHIQDVDTAAKGVVIGATAHRCKINKNVFNLSGGTGDVGITIASSADNCEILDNVFDDGISDPISDSGTDSMIAGNTQVGITGTSGASLALAVND